MWNQCKAHIMSRDIKSSPSNHDSQKAYWCVLSSLIQLIPSIICKLIVLPIHQNQDIGYQLVLECLSLNGHARLNTHFQMQCKPTYISLMFRKLALKPNYYKGLYSSYEMLSCISGYLVMQCHRSPDLVLHLWDNFILSICTYNRCVLATFNWFKNGYWSHDILD